MKPLASLPRLLPLIAMGAIIATLVGCASSSFHAGPAPALETSAKWVVAPLINNTATPYAGQRAEQLVTALLAQQHAGDVQGAPSAADGGGLPVDNGTAAEAAARTFATQQNARYLVRGSVDEWGYKIGLDGQPAVGFTLNVIDLESGREIWTGAASASGGSREGVAVLAQDTLNRLIERLMKK